MITEVDAPAAARQRTAKANQFSRLSQATYVDFNQFGQTWNNKVPFMRQPVAPAALGDFGVKLATESANDTRRICVGVQVQIASEVGPVVQRLDDRTSHPSAASACRI